MEVLYMYLTQLYIHAEADSAIFERGWCFRPVPVELTHRIQESSNSKYYLKLQQKIIL